MEGKPKRLSLKQDYITFCLLLKSLKISDYEKVCILFMFDLY